jgi:Ras-related GTP-binding protein A/B
MQQYLSTQQSTIFAAVGVLIYVFDVRSREVGQDGEYFRRILDALRRYSPNAAVFLLVHKMDLITQTERATTFQRRRAELIKDATAIAPGLPLQVFGTSIYDESLYKAWSRVVHTLIPNAAVLSKHLTTFAQSCSATEVVLFERTTFLVIATSEIAPPPEPEEAPIPLTPHAEIPSPSYATPISRLSLSTAASDTTAGESEVETDPAALHGLEPTRYERTSELIKAFKHVCAKTRTEFHGLELAMPECTAVLDEMTKNMYVLVVVHDPHVETSAIRMNIELARSKFEELQSDSTFG